MAKLLTEQVFRKTLASVTASIRPDTKDKSLVEMIRLGVTILRINLSWFQEIYKQAWITKIARISDIARDQKVILGIMLDTKGPEFRVGKIAPDTNPVKKEETRREYKADVEILLTLDPSVNCCDDRTIAVDAPGTRFGTLSDRVVFCDGDYEARIVSSKSTGVSIRIMPERPFYVWERAKVNFPGTVVTAKAFE